MRQSPATGRAECPVTALGLGPGDAIELKVGFRYYSNAASHVIWVVLAHLTQTTVASCVNALEISATRLIALGRPSQDCGSVPQPDFNAM